MSTKRTTPAERLAGIVRKRRDELDLTQLDVWQAGGPSNTKLTEIENGRMGTLTRTTARRLDQGLRWEPGSAKRAWEGGEPTPLGESSSAAPGERDELRRRILAAAYLSEAKKAALLETLDRGDDPPPAEEVRTG